MQTRRRQARQVRVDAAQRAYHRPHDGQLSNGDEDRHANRIAPFSKGLPHNQFGEVDADAYEALRTALSPECRAGLDAVPLGGALRLADPLAGLDFDLQGPDAQSLGLRPAPSLRDDETCAEMVELYWMALLRDVPFAAWRGNPDVRAAARELTALAAHRGPRDASGQVSARLLFRGDSQGDRAGPYVSQFLWLGTPHPSVNGGGAMSGRVAFGSLEVSQRQRTVLPGVDYLTTVEDWLAVQNGDDRGGRDDFDTATSRFIRSPRDLANWVHFGAPHQAWLNALTILLALNVPVDPGVPHRSPGTPSGLGTIGTATITSLLGEVATRALKVVWYSKWFVHRRPRPEELGGRIHFVRTGQRSYDLNPAVVEAPVLDRVLAHNERRNGGPGTGTYLLPVAYPEGCPASPSYGGGHAAVAGACATVLKAWFDGATRLRGHTALVQATEDGTALRRYTGEDADTLTVEGELDKLAANLSLGRGFAGLNWRSDYTASVRLGERVALALIEETLLTYDEDVRLSLTSFDGNRVNLSKRGTRVMAPGTAGGRGPASG